MERIYPYIAACVLREKKANVMLKKLMFTWPIAPPLKKSLPNRRPGYDSSMGGSRILEKGGGAWGVGDKLAVRTSQVCAPGGSEGMPPRNICNFGCIFLQFGAYFFFVPSFSFFTYILSMKGGACAPTPPWIRACLIIMYPLAPLGI